MAFRPPKRPSGSPAEGSHGVLFKPGTKTDFAIQRNEEFEFFCAQAAGSFGIRKLDPGRALRLRHCRHSAMVLSVLDVSPIGDRLKGDGGHGSGFGGISPVPLH